MFLRRLARSKRSARRGIVPEVLERFRQGTGVTGLDEESVHPVAETLGALSDAGCNHGQAGGEVLGKLQRRVVESAIPLGQDQRHIHCRSVRRELGEGDRTGEHGDNAAVPRQLLDLRPFRPVADHQEGGVVHPRGGFNRLLEGMEAAKAAHPSDHEPIVQPESPPGRAGVGTVREEIQVDAGRCDDELIVSGTEVKHPFGHHLGPTRDEIGTAQRGLLTAPLEPAGPSRPADPPLRRLPDQRGRNEQNGRASKRAGELEACDLEQLVTLPHEPDVRRPPRSVGVDAEPATAAPPPRIFCGGLHESGNCPTPW